MKFIAPLTATILGLACTISAIPTPSNTLIPDNISLSHGKTGQIEFNVPSGEISRSPTNGGDDISTLITFYFPESTRGKQCEFNFEIDDSTSTVSPVDAGFDVFNSLQPATASSPGWGPPNNGRDTQLGRLSVFPGSEATVEWGNLVFDCPASQTKGFEVVPTGDQILITWDEPTDGPWIRYF